MQTYNPRDTAILTHACRTYIAEWAQLTPAMHTAILADLDGMIQVEGWNTADAAVHMLAHRVRPASFMSYARTLLAGQR
jgi:hypothetical protein